MRGTEKTIGKGNADLDRIPAEIFPHVPGGLFPTGQDQAVRVLEGRVMHRVGPLAVEDQTGGSLSKPVVVIGQGKNDMVPAGGLPQGFPFVHYGNGGLKPLGGFPAGRSHHRPHA